MTAEVAILNKIAVALAADSAITFGSASEQKIYNTGNKLFALSKYRPVGIMVFGNAEFMGVPWETIIKFYRSRFKAGKFGTLIEYAVDFIHFLEKENSVLWTPQFQLDYYRGTVILYLQLLVSEINEKIKAELAKGKLTVEQIAQIVSAVIAVHLKRWQEAPDLFPECDAHIQRILENYGDVINQAKKDIFQQLPLSDESSSRITQICTLLFCKNIFSDSTSGVVIAGFGENEIFPSAASYTFEAIVSGTLKHFRIEYVQASRDSSAIIMPFAQREMVNTFIEGIDPSYREALDSYLQELILKYPESIMASIPELTEERKLELSEKLNMVAKEVLTDFIKKTNEYANNYHVSPVLQAVSALPKDELASMAESLVNLTSFKRKVSLQAETVGGPIDVAVISKGDGFIWIKRKHYFKPDLNQTFFSNYYREEPE